MDTTILEDKEDKIIYGRIEPRIYAFETHTVPNYLKVYGKGGNIHEEY